jgi:flagellar hook-basal body complex protein FliE
MVERIGRESALAREAMRAAQRLVTERLDPARSPAASETASATPAASPSTAGIDFERALDAGIEHVDREVRAAESLPVDLLTGKVDDFHEIAVQLKNAELSFKFAMEIRNKLIDAYREIMRMSV